ncbi:MAG: carbonic anhydrase [Actinomycetota bacterium]|nr:carbonic anhydrase [Actinomycetota bacterium]MDQ2956287.1 carbonic anhydrase [Actinomycetota bacterium]
MQHQFEDVLHANEQFAASYHDPGLVGQAARGLAIVTCMDSRIDPLGMLGLAKGDAKILRNAGARVTDDVLRTLVLATHLLGVERVMIVAHTDCRMTKASNDEIHSAIRDSAGIDTRSLDFGAIEDQQAVLAGDVQRVRSSPYLPVGLPVIGCLYHLDTARIEVVVPQQ